MQLFLTFVTHILLIFSSYIVTLYILCIKRYVSTRTIGDIFLNWTTVNSIATKEVITFFFYPILFRFIVLVQGCPSLPTLQIIINILNFILLSCTVVEIHKCMCLSTNICVKITKHFNYKSQNKSYTYNSYQQNFLYFFQ